jgi:hypothetical protein
MNDKTDRIVGASFSFGGTLTLYLYLKLTGNFPGPGWGILNEIDFYMVKAFHILKIGVPAFILVTFIFMYTKKLRERQENERQEKERQYEIYLKEERKKEEGILVRFQSIEAKVQELNDKLIQMNRSSTDITESVLQDFL